jgi:large subunit ribosomal protein L6
MSRIGRKPILLPKGVDVKIEGREVTVKGAKGTLQFGVLPDITVELQDGRIVVTRSDDEKHNRAAHGMTRAILNNMVTGVSQGFERILEIVGVGYRAQMQGHNLVMALGFSHPVEVIPPEGI